MEQNIKLSSSRWLGRLYGALIIVLKDKEVETGKLLNMSVAELYVEAQKNASQRDQALIDKLMSKFNETKEKETLNEDVNVAKEQQQLGVMEAKHISDTYGNLLMLLQECQFMEGKHKSGKKKKLYFVILLIVLLLGIIIYNLPYFREMRFFDKVMEERDIFTCAQYEEEYPDGRYLDDVLFLKVELTNRMDYITEYLFAFPEGKYMEVVNAKCDSIWDTEIVKYQKREKAGHSPEAVTYMQEMLQYMKRMRVNVINLDVESHLNLKDYTEYDKSLRTLMEIFSDTKSLPIADNMIPLKKNFTSGDHETLAGILVSGLQKSMDKIFTPQFIKVEYKSNYAKSPSVRFDYEVKNQEEKIGDILIPDIWTYTENKVPKSYLLGISIIFEAVFSIPNSSTKFTYKENGEPGKNINDIDDIKDGYRIMTQICFGQFANTMVDKLGLEEVYFKGDDIKDE